MFHFCLDNMPCCLLNRAIYQYFPLRHCYMISAPKHNILSILSSQNQGRARILNHPQTSPLFGSLLLVIGRLKAQLAATKAPLPTYCLTRKFSKDVETTRNSSKVSHLYLSKGYPLHLLLKCVCHMDTWRGDEKVCVHGR